jgi:hypothetical protein
MQDVKKLPEKIQQLNKYMHLLLKTASMNAFAVVVSDWRSRCIISQ